MTLPAGAVRRRALPYLLILPSVVALLSLIIYPMVFSLINSFYLWNLQTSPVPLLFVGDQNYRTVFAITPFLDALRNTLVLSIGGTFIQFWFGMGIALLLNSQLKGMSAARALLIMPTTIAPIVVGFLFRYMYYEGGGLISWLLTSAGFPVPPKGCSAAPKRPSPPSPWPISGSGPPSSRSSSTPGCSPSRTTSSRRRGWTGRAVGGSSSGSPFR